MEDLLHNQAFFAQNVAKLLMFISSKGYSCTFGEAWRPPEMAEIYAKEGKGIVDSQHCKRLAIDLNIYDQKGNWIKVSEDLKPFGDYWEALCNANRWGGNFTKHGGHIDDGDHWEMRSEQ
jgi:hypothetical protein